MSTHNHTADLSTNFRSVLKRYYQLTKPGIVYSNVLTAVAGYLFAGRFHIDVLVCAGLIVGTASVIAASCVVNNYLDRSIDARMKRTATRALVTGSIRWQSALLFAVVLYVIGFASLLATNGVTIVVAAVAVITYVGLYAVAKRQSVHGTLVGTVPGAAALVAGYTAVSGRFDASALVLFLIMVVWQMAHFYSIAIFRRDDYAAANIPVRPVSRDVLSTKRQIVGYIILFIIVSPLLALTSAAGYVYAFGMIVLGLWWLSLARKGWTEDDVKWARRMFGRSLIVLLVFCALLPIGAIVP